MPAPKTSTDRMPEIDASMFSPAGTASACTTLLARPSAAPTTASGTIQSTGLRYVMIRRAATTMTVTSSSRKSAPANEFATSS